MTLITRKRLAGALTPGQCLATMQENRERGRGNMAATAITDAERACGAGLPAPRTVPVLYRYSFTGFITARKVH